MVHRSSRRWSMTARSRRRASRSAQTKLLVVRERDAQVRSVQDVSDQPAPVQGRPYHSPPDPLVAARHRLAQSELSNVFRDPARGLLGAAKSGSMANGRDRAREGSCGDTRSNR
jgi:hypothetical protein